MRFTLLGLVKGVVFLTVTWFVGRALQVRIASLPAGDFDVDAAFLLLGVAFMATMPVVMAAGLHSLLASFRVPLSWPVVLASAWTPMVGRYVPGKVATLVGGLYYLTRHGIAAKTATTILLLRTAFSVGAGLAVAAPLAGLALSEEVRSLVSWGLLVAAPGAILLHPRLLERLCNRLLRWSGREPMLPFPSLRSWVPAIFCILGNRVILGFVLWALARSLGPLDIGMLPLVISAYALASVLGFLAFFSPGGLGVQEGFLLVLLEPWLGGARAAVTVVLIRLLEVARDLAFAGLGLAISRRVAKNGR